MDFCAAQGIALEVYGGMGGDAAAGVEGLPRILASTDVRQIAGTLREALESNVTAQFGCGV